MRVREKWRETRDRPKVIDLWPLGDAVGGDGGRWVCRKVICCRCTSMTQRAA